MYQGLDIASVMPSVVASGLMVSTCTVQAPNGQFGSSGAPSGTYANVSGLVAIQCMDAPLSVGSVDADESKTMAEIASRSLRHVLLDRYYPQLDGLNWGGIGWRAILTNTVSGISRTYDILGTEPSSQANETRLRLQLVSV